MTLHSQRWTPNRFMDSCLILAKPHDPTTTISYVYTSITTERRSNSSRQFLHDVLVTIVTKIYSTLLCIMLSPSLSLAVGRE